jgi:hypothetical protein
MNDLNKILQTLKDSGSIVNEVSYHACNLHENDFRLDLHGDPIQPGKYCLTKLYVLIPINEDA